jgi:Ni/Co efflux regulator RcnB
MAAPFNAQVTSHSTVTQVDWKKPDHRKVQKRVIKKKHSAHRSHWRHGQKYSNWKRHRAVDWRRHHLRHPGAGQRWIQVGNDYLLVSILTGVIAEWPSRTDEAERRRSYTTYFSVRAGP